MRSPNPDDTEAYRIQQAEALMRAVAVLRGLEDVETDQFLNSDSRVQRLKAALRVRPLDPGEMLPMIANLETHIVGRKWGAMRITEIEDWLAARDLAGE